MTLLEESPHDRARDARAQRAADVTAMLFVANDRIDVRRRLLVELDKQNVEATLEWVEQTTQQIHDGEPAGQPVGIGIGDGPSGVEGGL